MRLRNGTNTITKGIEIDSKEGIQVIPERYSDRIMYFRDKNHILEISLEIGFETSKSDEIVYLSEFDQILSTFRFGEGFD